MALLNFSASWLFSVFLLFTFAATKLAVDRARRGDGPAIIFADTFRMGGHATHDEKEARSMFDSKLFSYWGKRDPIGNFEYYLKKSGVSKEILETAEEGVIKELEQAEASALESRQNRMPSPESVLDGVYAG